MLQAKAPTPQSSPPRPRPCHSGHTQHLRTNGIERERERESKEEADGSDVGATAATAAVRRRGGHQGWVWVWVWVFVSDFVSFDLVVQARPRKEGNGSAPPTANASKHSTKMSIPSLDLVRYAQGIRMHGRNGVTQQMHWPTRGYSHMLGRTA